MLFAYVFIGKIYIHIGNLNVLKSLDVKKKKKVNNTPLPK